jgi:hypothetical protein
MAELRTFPPDNRPCALYLVAHLRPLRDPHPIELQRMRIDRHIDLLREYKDAHHAYSEDEDIYVEFNLYPPKEYPALMRLGERRLAPIDTKPFCGHGSLHRILGSFRTRALANENLADT